MYNGAALCTVVAGLAHQQGVTMRCSYSAWGWGYDGCELGGADPLWVYCVTFLFFLAAFVYSFSL